MTFHRKPRRERGKELKVEAGQVVCPRRGLRDVEDCWVCEAALGIGGCERILCGAAASGSLLPLTRSQTV
jgi:hypothetical protein